MTGGPVLVADDAPAVPPGPRPADMLRSIRRMRQDTLGFLSECSARYGDVVAFPVPGPPALLITHPDDIRRVLVANKHNYGKRTIQYDTLALVTGRGLLTNDGDSWMRRRRLTQPAFHHGQLQSVGGHVASAVAAVQRNWDDLLDAAGGRPVEVDVDAVMMRAALDVVGRSLFTTDFGRDADRLIAAVLSALDLVVARAASPMRLPLSVPTPGNLRMRRAVATLDEAVAPLIAARRSRADGPGGDLLGAYLSAGEEDPDRRLSDTEIRDEVVTLIVAGHETVASSLTWTWHLLGAHPEIADAVADEAAAVLGGRPPTAADLHDLDLTRRVIEESLRLYPPAWVISRRAAADDVLGGYAVPAESVVMISPFVTQHDERFWPDPEAFDPDRFTVDRRADAGRSAYFPFGAGPSLCIGRDFALLESVLMLAALSQRYRVAPIPGRPVRAEPLVTIRPHGGLPMRITRR